MIACLPGCRLCDCAGRTGRDLESPPSFDLFAKISLSVLKRFYETMKMVWAHQFFRDMAWTSSAFFILLRPSIFSVEAMFRSSSTVRSPSVKYDFFFIIHAIVK